MLVIGVGNETRGDDAIGPLVARKLSKLCDQSVSILEQSGEGAALMSSWCENDAVFIIDAVQSGKESGTIFRFDVHQEPIPRKFFHYSTHDFSVAEAIELARVLKTLPPRVIIYGVEGACFEPGIDLTPSVEAALDNVAESIRREIEAGR